jgi:ABC-type enterobactin transport system permease subunit
MLRSRDLHAAIAQDKAGIRQARLGANVGSLPHAEVIPVLGQKLTNHGKPRLILREIGIRVFLDLNDFLMCAPDDQNVRCVAVLCELSVSLLRWGPGR